MQGALMGLSPEEMEENYENIKEFADIGNFIDQPVKTYSSGNVCTTRVRYRYKCKS